MKEANTPIKIRVTRRDSSLNEGDPRESFWGLLRETRDESNSLIASFEGRFVRRFGQVLRDELIQNLERGLGLRKSAHFHRIAILSGSSSILGPAKTIEISLPTHS